MPDVQIMSKYGMLDEQQFEEGSPERGYGGPILTAQARRDDDLLTEAQAAHKKVMDDNGLNNNGRMKRWAELFKKFRDRFIREETTMLYLSWLGKGFPSPTSSMR